MVYAVSDLHGCYDKFRKLLEMIRLTDDDVLYVLGDVVDRGPEPMAILRDMSLRINVFPILGNHELMALECLKFLMKEITEESINELDSEKMDNLLTWIQNGGDTTINEFHKLDRDEQEAVIDFIMDFLIYEEISVNGSEYLLVHAGLGNYAPEKEIDDYSIKELVWDGAEYDIQYFPDKFVVTGHTPTQYIAGNPRPGFIYRNNNHIAIDCGSCRPDGRLAAICLDTGEEFYSEAVTAGNEG